MFGAVAIAGYAAYAMIAHDIATGGGMLADPIGTFVDLGLWQVVLAGSIAIAVFELVVMIAFAAHAVTRRQLSGSAKALWIAAFYLLAPFSLPLYWLVHMLPEADEPAELY